VALRLRCLGFADLKQAFRERQAVAVKAIDPALSDAQNEGPDGPAATEKAATEFKVPANRLVALRR
jgi:hypothetical protein